MYIYKDGKRATCSPDQLAPMQEAGWSLIPPKVKAATAPSEKAAKTTAKPRNRKMTAESGNFQE